MVSIILVSYNKHDITIQCVESIRRNVIIPYEIIIVDNNSKSETIEALKNIDGIRLILNNENKGFPSGCNDGCRIAKGDIIWFLNNDTIVPPKSLERMVELLISDDKIGMVGPVTNHISGNQQIPVTYTHDNEIDTFASFIAQKYMKQTTYVIRLVGFSLLIRKSTLSLIGGFDERMGVGFFEDDDLSLRLVVNGYKLLIAKDAFIHHLGSISFKAAMIDTGYYPSLNDRNQRLVSNNFGITVPDEIILNEDILPFIPDNIHKILHVECGGGSLGLHMRERGKYIVGLDSNINKIKISHAHYNAIINYSSIEPFELSSIYDEFDMLIIEQQLNHDNTLSIIRNIKRNLAAFHRVLIHIPKITAINNDVYHTYFENWKSDGLTPNYGSFNISFFIQQMRLMGYKPKHLQYNELNHGLFNHYSFMRYKNNKITNPGELSYFAQWIGLFDKYNKHGQTCQTECEKRKG